MSITKIYHGREILSLIYEIKLCDAVNCFDKENSLTIGKILGVESKTCDDIRNNGWNMADLGTEQRKLIQANHTFKQTSNKIAYLNYPEHPTFHKWDDAKGMNIYQSMKQNLSNITFMGRKERWVASVGIISKSFKLKHACEII